MTFDLTAGSAPIAKKNPIRSIHHGIERFDDYAWLRADNWQAVMRDPLLIDEEIRKHLEAENAYQKALMADTEALQALLVGEMRGRIKEDDSSVPMKDGPWAYGSKYEEGGEHPKFTRLPYGGGETEILLDGDKEAEGKEYFRIGGAGHSPDHNILSWSFDDKGSEMFTIHFRDLQSGADLEDTLTETVGGGVFSNDTKQFIYTKVDENHRPSKLFAHTIGESADDDRLIFEESNPGFFLSAGKTQSDAFIVISTHDHESSQAYILPADDIDQPPLLVAKREKEMQYSVDEAHGTLYILTNRDGAKDFKIVTAPTNSPSPDNWQDLVPHQSGRLILAHSVYCRHLVWLERSEGLPKIIIRRLSDGQEHAIAFDEEAYSLGLAGAMEFDTDVIRFTYSSMTTPQMTFDYNMETRERKLLKTQEVPSGHDPENYVTRRVQARAADGEMVPITLLYRKDTKLDGSAPCLLYGYGSYGMTIPAGFNSNCLSLVDRGFVYAISHIRGGKDKGFGWYESGKREYKKNTFSDFIASTEYLIENKFTSKGKIVPQGGSAGGMLMGAIVNMAPELFAGVIAEVPFVDVLNTMLDDTLPLTPPEWPEWGNPIESKAAYEYIASYSPYDQVTKQHYPPILALAGLTDPRVTYWEPAKWVARLREFSVSDSPIMLKTNMGAGHGGASGRFQRLEEIAVSYAFAIKAVGLLEKT